MAGDAALHLAAQGETAVGGVPEVKPDANPRVGALRGGGAEAGERPRRHVRRLTAQLDWFRRMVAGDLPFVVTEGGGGPERLGVVCGFLGCDVVPFNPVLAALPTVIRLASPPPGAGDRLSQLVDFAVAEARERRAGSDCVRLRISELMFVELVRRYLSGLPAEQTGWLAGLRDPYVGRALELLHQDPARAWTLETRWRGNAPSLRRPTRT
jgi:hypothetical protein